jgi:branched-subunit amino acid transport protein
VTGDLVLLALLMAAVTYPSRALPLLAPGLDRLPAWALEYLRLVGPAVLAALAAVNTAVVVVGSRPSLHPGVAWLAVGAAVAIVIWRRNLLPALLVAVALAAGLRAVGFA